MATCNRCDGSNVSGLPLTTVTVALDDRAARIRLCERCLRNIRADVGGYLNCGDPVRSSYQASEPLEPYLWPPKSEGVPGLPEPTPVDPSRKYHQVRIPTRRRTEVIPDEPELLAPEILHGRDERAVRIAAQRWTMSARQRAKCLANNLDPVDVLLAAEVGTVTKTFPDAERKVYNGIIVIVDTRTSTITGAFHAVNE